MAAERATLVSVHCQLYDYQRDWLRKNAARGDRNAALRAALDDYIQKIDGENDGQEQEDCDGNCKFCKAAKASIDRNQVSP